MARKLEILLSQNSADDNESTTTKMTTTTTKTTTEKTTAQSFVMTPNYRLIRHTQSRIERNCEGNENDKKEDDNDNNKDDNNDDVNEDERRISKSHRDIYGIVNKEMRNDGNIDDDNDDDDDDDVQYKVGIVQSVENEKQNLVVARVRRHGNVGLVESKPKMGTSQKLDDKGDDDDNDDSGGCNDMAPVVRAYQRPRPKVKKDDDAETDDDDDDDNDDDVNDHEMMRVDRGEGTTRIEYV